MFKPEGFSLDIFKNRYAFTKDETWEEACTRVAAQIAVAESPEKNAKYKDKFNEILVNNIFVPGGRIWYNSGRPNPQLLNCFVLGDELDSKEGWGELSKEMIITSMTGGGCGTDFSDVRPQGAEISGHNGSCPGPLSLMELINFNGVPVRAGGSRRVALMFSLSLRHPDVLKFIRSKLTNGNLQLANISVNSRDTLEFIKAVKNDSIWELSWKGKCKVELRARELWDEIVTNAYNSAEPGFLNMELAESESNIYYIEKLSTTNPCGEIFLSPYDCCCLGHLVLPRFMVDGGVDWHLLAESCRTAVRFLDNVLTVNHYPMKKMKDKSHKLRRIGLGTTGLADLLALLGIKYGSEESITFIDELYRFISKASYEASVMLAVEKGPFQACEPKKHVKSGFIKRMPKKIRALIEEHGIRNCAILTQAPTGTVSIISGNCSSGIEPMFAPAYERRYWDKNERKTELVFHPLFKKFMDDKQDVSHFVGSMNLSVRDHMLVQATIQKHVDNAVSKTINMPQDYPIEEMSKLWLEFLPVLKGTTFYRENSRGYVDEKGVLHEPPLKALSLEEAIERFNKSEENSERQEVDCQSGLCEI